MLKKIPFVDDGYFYESDESKFALSSTPEYLQGYFYIQDAASQISVKILNPKPSDVILDMAASPGGKTTQVAAAMQNKGIIVALDVKSDRIKNLKNNIERLGAKNIVVFNKDSRYASDLGVKFDKVLLDAPCSGNFCIDKDWFEKRELHDFNQKAFIQKSLLKEAVKVLKKKGELVYSTCSLEIEENENVIEWSINKLGVKLIDIDIDIGDDGLTKKTKYTKRLWPNKTLTQGFFVAKMIKQ